MNDKDERIKIAKLVEKRVRENIGDFAKLRGVIIVHRLPNTRSGKIVRATIRKIANKQEYSVPATIEDPSALDEIAQACQDFFGAN